MLLLAFVICIASFALLAAATSRQQDVLFHRKLVPARTRTARIAGWCGLVVALVADVTSQGWALGLVTYSGHTSAAAGLVFLALILRSRAIR